MQMMANISTILSHSKHCQAFVRAFEAFAVNCGIQSVHEMPEVIRCNNVDLYADRSTICFCVSVTATAFCQSDNALRYCSVSLLACF